MAITNPSATVISAATTFSGTPTVAQLVASSYAFINNINDFATFVAELSTSAFVGTLTFYGLEVDGISLVPISGHLRSSSAIANNTAISTAVALNQVWAGSIATFGAFYVVCTAFTSGTVSVRPGLSASLYALSVSNVTPTNLNQINGATLAPGNPNIVEQNVSNWIRNGQGFVYATVNGAVTATNPSLTVCALSIFNPANSGKNIWIFDLETFQSGGSSTNQIRSTTTDPSGGTGITGAGIVTNLKFGGAVSVASVSCSPSGITASPTAPGTFVANVANNNNLFVDFLTNGAGILLPPGNGIAVMIFVPVAAQVFGAVAKGIEY